ncbi:hypothetical protein DX933_07600 [Ornithinibacillus gellani]|uniref:hypothetical protein n=1 Tax=Ornithinibacillus gellani TaxID=2293253 RepID=UPI000F473A39|nr:hypothetical protein [Ornithinibacillus gellani]TQS75195.1 hypothetical protein DX933_07600 [Ornithinibacillus gellani]
MPRLLKIMLFFTLGLPSLVTVLRIATDSLLGNPLDWFSYTASFFGIAAGGLIFATPLYYLISKSNEE